MKRAWTGLVVSAWVIGWLLGPAAGADWPTYRGDIRRSGIAGEPLKPPLSAEWVFTPTHPPAAAWGDPQAKPVEGLLELPRLRFDDAFHVAAAGGPSTGSGQGRVYFGSSADNKVYALDAATGEVVWEFYTDGPVRLAPTVAAPSTGSGQARVYVGSDDGNVYCLDAAGGRLVWKFPAAPDRRMVLGNGKMISLWPVRTGVLVDGGVAYFGAGVFPAEGLYLYAVSAADGKCLWKNDTYGEGGVGTVSPQGYLLASADRLFVPSGRAMPAAFARSDGQFLYHRNQSWRRVGLFGGTFCLLAGDLLFNGTEQILAIRQSDGGLAMAEGLKAATPSTGTRRLVVDQDVAYLTTGAELIAYNRHIWITMKARQAGLREQIRALGEPGGDEAGRLQQKRELLAEYAKVSQQLGSQTKWRVPCESSDSLVLAEGLLLAGGSGAVAGYDPRTGKEVWSAAVAGRARGLAVAHGRLVVSTDAGGIHCFVPGRKGKGRAVAPAVVADPFPAGAASEAAAKLAARIVSETGIRRGHALVLGGDGRLVLELARRTELMIHAVHPDAGAVAKARQALSAAGVYGPRAVVMQAPLDALPYSDYFANLIVAQDAPTPPEEVLRMLKPCGGAAVILGAEGKAGEVAKRLAALDGTGATVAGEGGWVKIARGPLPGAGSWTHQYAEPGNTAAGDDRLIRGPLGVLWFGEPGPGRMPSRHAAAAAPLAAGGRLFVQGENVLMAHDAYNGLKLWQRELPGAIRLGLKKAAVSNLAANDDSLFVAVGGECLRLDAATGKTLKTYTIPQTAGERKAEDDPAAAARRAAWDYLACVGGLVYGSAGETIFAVDVESGKIKWTRRAGRLDTTTICISGGRLFHVDGVVTPEQAAAAVAGLTEKPRPGRQGAPDVRLVVALSAETGRQEWASPQYVGDCVEINPGGGGLTVMAARGVVLLAGQPWNGHFWKEFLAGQFSRRSLIALSAENGSPIWSGHKGYRSRPLIIGETIIAEPWAYDLRTGADRLRASPVTGKESRWQMSRPGHHCGNIAGAANMLFFRSGTTGWYDLAGDYGTAHFGGHRGGCWINCIPAGGLALMPEASSGCQCPYALMCTVAWAPRRSGGAWGMYSAAGPLTPVKRLAVNLGAPGDRRDAAGLLWLAYPRPLSRPEPEHQRLVLDFKLPMNLAPGGGFFARNADFLRLAGTEDPWIYASGCEGLTELTIPLNEKGAAEGRYTVRLHFAEPAPGASSPQPPKPPAAGQRVFSVSLQGKEVLKDLDIAAEAAGPDRAVVKTFKAVPAAESMRLSFHAAKGKGLLCGLEVIAE